MKFAVVSARPALFGYTKKTRLFVSYYDSAVNACAAAREIRESARKDDRWPLLFCKAIGIKSR